MLKQNHHSLFASIREDFPILQSAKEGKRFVYLDSAASAQKPQQVISAIARFYSHDYANIHRGIYELSARATDLFEASRVAVKQFINAQKNSEIIFVRGTTEGINAIAQSFGRSQWQAGDEVILSTMEHHSNIVPWYLLKEQIGIELKVIPIADSGELDLAAYRALFSARTRLVAISHAGNAFGNINPVKAMIATAHELNVPVLVDGAQAVPHFPVDVTDLDCDFYVFSGHKIYGPTGIGVLYAKHEHLVQMPPYQGGGNMIETVQFDKITYAHTPQKFEAGTPDIVGAIGLASAIEYINKIGMSAVAAHEQELLQYAEAALNTVPGLKMIGTAHPKVGVISFVMEGIHPHDIGTVLDHENIAVRAGHHCAMPLMQRFNLPATVRASFGIYNHEGDVDALVTALLLAKRLFS